MELYNRTTFARPNLGSKLTAACCEPMSQRGKAMRKVHNPKIHDIQSLRQLNCRRRPLVTESGRHKLSRDNSSLIDALDV
ncbi:hypothetical protein PT974_06228 [Cladobotryum mycophilum]|uniref:Uncharacterized protein n=1 Tax=Cladobotryum mycophilum TaxID=491253 RepID=A0ABR0SL97_9HYPO